MVRSPLLVIVLVVVVTCLAMPTTHVQGRTVDLESDLTLDYSPETLTLKPDEEATIIMVIQNHGDRSQVVVLGYVRVDAPGASSGTFDTTVVEVGPGASAEVRLTVRSNAHPGQEEGVSEGMVKFAWGENLTGTDIWELDENLVEGTYQFVIPVTDELTIFTTPVLLALVALLLVIIAFTIIVNRVRLKQG